MPRLFFGPVCGRPNSHLPFFFSLSTLVLFTHRDIARRTGRDLIERRVAVQKNRGVGCLDGGGRERGDADDGEQRG